MQKLIQLDEDLTGFCSLIKSGLETEYSENDWSDIQQQAEKFDRIISDGINSETVHSLEKQELELLQNMALSYRQMLVAIESKKEHVSEELRKIKQREQISFAYDSSF